MRHRFTSSTGWLLTAGTVSLMAAGFYFAACGGGGGGGGSDATTFSGNISQTTAFFQKGSETHRFALRDLLGVGKAYAAVNGIEVRIPQAGASTVTDDTGSFVLQAEASGEVELEFEGPGLLARMTVSGVPAGGTVVLQDLNCSHSHTICEARNIDRRGPNRGSDDDDDDSPSNSPSASNSPSDSDSPSPSDSPSASDSPSDSDDDNGGDDNSGSGGGGGGNSGPG